MPGPDAIGELVVVGIVIGSNDGTAALDALASYMNATQQLSANVAQLTFTLSDKHALALGHHFGTDGDNRGRHIENTEKSADS